MIEFRLKEKTKSLNESFRGDWKKRHGIARAQRAKAMKACPPWPKSEPLLVVRLTRVSIGTLDDDALPAALKHVRDGVAGRLRIDDASPLVRWEYEQAKGPVEVVVQVFKAGESVPVPLILPTVEVDARTQPRVSRQPGTGVRRAPRPAYEPPRTLPVDAAALAADTFAPEAE